MLAVLNGRINDMALCEECAGRLERDLIRERAWDHSATAYGVSADQREELRRRVVRQYGEKLELIAPTNTGSKKRRARRKKGRLPRP
jgi:hypothetical protein